VESYVRIVNYRLSSVKYKRQIANFTLRAGEKFTPKWGIQVSGLIACLG